MPSNALDLDTYAFGIQQRLDAEIDPPSARRELSAALGEYKLKAQAKGVEPFSAYFAEQARRESLTRALFKKSDAGTYDVAPIGAGYTGNDLAGYKQRTANIAYLAQRYRMPAHDASMQYSALRDRVAREDTGKPAMGDGELFSHIAGSYELDDALQQEAISAGMKGTPAMQAFASKLPEWKTHAGWSEVKSEAYRRRFEAVHNAYDAAIAPYRGIVHSTAADLQRLMGAKEGEPQVDWQGAEERLRSVPQDKRDLVLSAIATVGAPEGGDTKGVLQKLGENIWRGSVPLAEGVPLSMARSRLLYVSKRAKDDAIGVPALWSGSDEVFQFLMNGADDDAELKPASQRGERRKLTDAEKTDVLGRVDRALDAAELVRQIQDIADSKIDPASSGSLLARGLYNAARSVPQFAAAFVPVAGWGAMAGQFAEDNYAQLRRDNPGMSRETANAVATVSAPVQAVTEVIGDRFLAGRLPSLSKMLKAPVTTWATAGKRLAGLGAAGLVTETGEEVAQDLTPYLAQDLFNALGADAPDVDWSKVRKGEWQKMPEILATVPWLVLAGSGGAQLVELGQGRYLAARPELLEASGYSKDASGQISEAAKAGDWQKAQDLMRKEWDAGQVELDGSRLQPQREAAAAAVREEAARHVEAIASLEAQRVIPSVRATATGAQWVMPDGSTVDFASRAEAEAARLKQIQDIGLRDHQLVHEVLTNAERANQEWAFPVVVSAEEMTGTRAAEEGIISKEGLKQRQSVPFFDDGAAEAASFEEGKAAANVTATDTEAAEAAGIVLGRNVVDFKNQIRTITLYQGGHNLPTLIHEVAETHGVALLKNGKRQFLIDSLREVERSANEEGLDLKLFRTANDAELNDNDVREAWSEFATAYVAGKHEGRGITRTHNRVSSTRLGAVIDAFMRVLKGVMRRMGMIQQLQKSGKLSGDLQMEVARALGLEGAVQDTKTEQEAKAMADEMRAKFADQSIELSSENAPFSLAPGELDARLSRIFDPFQRKPEARARLVAEMRRRIGKMTGVLKEAVGRSVTFTSERELSLAAATGDKQANQRLEKLLELKAAHDLELGGAKHDKMSKDGLDQMRERHREQLDALRRSWIADDITAKDKERLLAWIRAYNAILSALPAEIRGKVGGYIDLASAAKDETRLTILEEKSAKAAELLEDWLRKDYTKQMGALVRKSRPKGKDGDKPKGSIGGVSHDWFADMEKALNLEANDAATRIAELEGMLAVETDPEKVIAISRELAIVEVFGGWENMSATEMSGALESARDIYKRGRDEWQAIVESRRQQDGARRETIINDLGAEGNLASKSRGGKSRKSSPIRVVTDAAARFLMTPRMLLKEWLGAASNEAERIADAELRAQIQFRNGVIEAEDGLQAAIDRAFGGSTTRRQRDDFVWKTLQPNKTVSILVGRKTHMEKVSIEDARVIVEESNPGYSLDQREQMRKQIEMHDAAVASRLRTGQRKNVTFEVVEDEGHREDIENFTEAEASYWLALYDQEGLRPALLASGFDETAIASLQAVESPQLRDVRRWMVERGAKEHGEISRVYAALNGVNLPKIQNYFTARFVHDGNKEAPDVTGGGSIASGGMKTGALRNRKIHQAQVATDFDGHSINLFAVHQDHVASMEYWKAYAPLVREMKATFGAGAVQEAFKAAHGEEQAKELSRWVRSVEGGGLATAEMNELLRTWLSRSLSGKASAGMGFKISTHLVNLTSAFNTLLDASIPLKEVLRSYGRVIAGKGHMSLEDAWNSPMLQRRLKQGTNPITRLARQAVQGMRPGLLRDVNHWGFESIGRADTMGATVAVASAYDAHYRSAKKGGLSDSEARDVAQFETEKTISRVLQPIEQSSKSLSEVSGNVALKMFSLFMSESRQKVGLEAAALRNLSRLKLTAADARVLAINHLLLGSLVWFLRSLSRDLQDDRDERGEDDPTWEWRDWLTSVILGPITGVPFLGSAANYYLSKSIGGHSFIDSNNPILDGFINVQRGLSGLWKGSSDEEFEGFLNHSNQILQGSAEIVGGPTSSAIAILGNVVTQVFNLADNLIED